MNSAQQQVDGIEYARALLVSWGEWMQRCDAVFRGHRGSASFIRGIGGPATSDGLDMPDHIALADRILAQLKQHNAVLFWSVAHAYWMNDGQALAAAKLKVSEKTFKVYKARGEEFVAGCLAMTNLRLEKKC